jgi:hypothetical protein
MQQNIATCVKAAALNALPFCGYTFEFSATGSDYNKPAKKSGGCRSCQNE